MSNTEDRGPARTEEVAMKPIPLVSAIVILVAMAIQFDEFTIEAR